MARCRATNRCANEVVIDSWFSAGVFCRSCEKRIGRSDRAMSPFLSRIFITSKSGRSGYDSKPNRYSFRFHSFYLTLVPKQMSQYSM